MGQGFVNAVSAVLEAGAGPDAARPQAARRAALALAAVHVQLQVFHAACDRAQDHLERAKQRTLSRGLEDDSSEALLRSAAGASAPAGASEATKISAAQLEELSNIVRGLAQDLQRQHPGFQGKLAVEVP
eukprot:SM000206S06290  [mRNA]  locus=s206:196625:197431:- [translate_table: standard]